MHCLNLAVTVPSLFFTKVELGPEEAPGEIEIIFSVFPEIEKTTLIIYIPNK